MSERENVEVKALAVHPGEYIAEELEARGWSEYKLAKESRLPLDVVRGILLCAIDINANHAAALATAFGVSPLFFRNLQATYDTWILVRATALAKTRIADLEKENERLRAAANKHGWAHVLNIIYHIGMWKLERTHDKDTQ